MTILKMTNVATARLIELVKQHPCLYDSSHKEYKNVATKNEIWEVIGREFNTTGEIIKNKWKTLRDGFTKNKKQLKEKAVTKTYTWAPQLAFLEDYLQKQPSTELTPSSPFSMDLDPLASVDYQTPSDKELSLEDTFPIEDPTPAVSQNKPAKRKIPEDEDDVTRIINYLSKKKNKDDEISHLFLSYAETFRKFPEHEQILLKIQLAKLFSNVELKLLESVERNQYILSTNIDQNSLQMEDGEISRPRVCVKEEPEDSYTDDNQDLSKILEGKEEELKKANEQILCLNKELDMMKHKNSVLETRNANLEAAVDDLKIRVNNLV